MSYGEIARRIVFAVAMILVTGIDCARSQPTDVKTYNTQPDKRGTQEKPLAVKLIPTEKTEQETQKEASENAVKAAYDKRTLDTITQQTDFTGRLVYIGWFQFGVFVLQLFAFACQANWMRHTVREMDVSTKATVKAANAAATSAKAAIEQTAHLEASVTATQKAANAADLSARTSAIAELPILHVGKIGTTIPFHSDVGAWLDYFVPTITINNFGRSPAFISEVLINVEITILLPDIPQYKTLNRFPDSYVIEAGKPIEVSEPLYIRQLRPSKDITKLLVAGSIYLFVFGRIRYKDCWDGSHECGFIGYWLGGTVEKFVQAPPGCEQYKYHRRIDTENRTAS